MLLDSVLQPDSLKLKLCKFNIIINIINIILRSSVAARPKAFGYIFAEKPNTLTSEPFFFIFYARKKI